MMKKLLLALAILSPLAEARNTPTDTVQFSTQGSAPSSPLAGTIFAYPLTSDGNLYTKNSAGTAKKIPYSTEIANADLTGSAAITNANLAQMANGRIKCRTSSGTGLPEDCTAAEINAITAAFTTVGAFGSAPDAKGASSSGNTITIQPGDATHPGALSIAAQDIAGQKRFLDAIGMQEVSTPANPSATYHKIYFKSDGKLYKLDSAGSEVEIAAGAGGAGSQSVARFTCGQGVPASNTVNLINFDSTTFYDYGVPGIAGWAYAAGCARSTSTPTPKFGAGQMECTSSGSLNDTSPETLITIATGNFTIDLWVYIGDLNENGIFGAGDGGAQDDGDMEFYWNQGTAEWKFVSKAGATVTTVSGSDSISANTWYHVAVVRSGTNTLTIYRDGVSKGSGIANNDLSITSGGTKTLYFGWAPTANERLNPGALDEIRISNVARWTSGFTPESSSYLISNTISSDPDTMIASVAGGTDPGVCTVNFTGAFFGTEPKCWCNIITATEGESGCRFTANNTASVATLKTRVNGALANGNVYFGCQE